MHDEMLSDRLQDQKTQKFLRSRAREPCRQGRRGLIGPYVPKRTTIKMGGVIAGSKRNHLMVATIQQAAVRGGLLPCVPRQGVAVKRVHLQALFSAVIVTLMGVCGIHTANAGYAPVDVVATAAKLSTLSLNNKQSIAADGQTLNRSGLEAEFTEGRFHPIVRDDGRIAGLVFEGRGRLKLSIPEGVETAAWQAATNFAPWEQEFTGGYLRFSDTTLADLQGERSIEAVAGTPSSFRMYNARSELLATPEWTRWQPGLIVDQLMDLYGGGHVGGHLLAEFRLAGTNPGGWLSYLHNPRGALLEDETTALYQVTRRGAQVPPELKILSSFGNSPETTTAFDVTSTTIDITFPTRHRNDRNLIDADVKSEIDLVALRRDRPLKALTLELESQRPLCTAQSYRPKLKLARVVDSAGRSLAAIHRGSKLWIPLQSGLEAGQAERIYIDYGGAMTQGIPGKKADTFFSEIGPWAWYPRNPRPDRSASRVSIHLPRFMRGVAPGAPTETREDKDGWHYVYEEPGGVLNLTLVVGDFLRSKESEGGINPKVITWYPATDQKSIRGTADGSRKILDFVASVWGPYPYSTLHIVESVPYPPRNWGGGETGSDGSWSCVPPGNLHAWQGVTTGPSGMLLSTSRTTAPAVDLEEARAIDRVLLEASESGKYLRVVDLARQWWGHMVPPASYRDAWIGEAMAIWTGLVFMQASVGRGALKERLDTMHDLMVDASGSSPPLSTGERLGRFFPFQIWGRGPLIVNSLVERLSAKVFLNSARTMINRSAGPGIDTATFVDTLGAGGTPELLPIVNRAVNTAPLAELEFNYSIDKESGRIDLLIHQVGKEVVPVDIWVQAEAGLKKKEGRLVTVHQREVVVQWKPQIKARKLSLDPLKTSLTRSIRRDRGLKVIAGADD